MRKASVDGTPKKPLSDPEDQSVRQLQLLSNSLLLIQNIFLQKCILE